MGPLDDEPEPTEAELEAAAALRDALEHHAANHDALARWARDEVATQAPLTPSFVTRAVDEGLVRRRARRRVAVGATFVTSVALAAAVVLGVMGAPRGATDAATRAALSTPLPEGESASERLDRLARAATHDWLTARASEAR